MLLFIKFDTTIRHLVQTPNNVDHRRRKRNSQIELKDYAVWCELRRRISSSIPLNPVESAILKSSSETTQFGVNLRQRIRSSIPLNRESRIESEKSRIPRDCASWPPIHDENVFPRSYTLITLFSMVLYANSVFLIVLSFIRKLWL